MPKEGSYDDGARSEEGRIHLGKKGNMLRRGEEGGVGKEERKEGG
jgi:hypothetical protein